MGGTDLVSIREIADACLLDIGQTVCAIIPFLDSPRPGAYNPNIQK